MNTKSNVYTWTAKYPLCDKVVYARVRAFALGASITRFGQWSTISDKWLSNTGLKNNCGRSDVHLNCLHEDDPMKWHCSK